MLANNPCMLAYDPFQSSPMVQVIMPTRNEARYIRCSLGAVLAQGYPADPEK